MFSIFSSIIGFLGGFMPDVLKYFKQKQDNAHELSMLDKQIEMAKVAHTQAVEIKNMDADIAESQALYKSAELKPSGVGWIDGLLYFYNSTVRPTITYGFVGLYGLHKVSAIKLAMDSGTDKWLILRDSYTEYDQATLSLVLGYWFGQRMATKVFKLK